MLEDYERYSSWSSKHDYSARPVAIECERCETTHEIRSSESVDRKSGDVSYSVRVSEKN